MISSAPGASQSVRHPFAGGDRRLDHQDARHAERAAGELLGPGAADGHAPVGDPAAAQFLAEVRSVAKGFLAVGLEPGDRAAIWAPNLLSLLVGSWVDRQAHRKRLLVLADLLARTLASPSEIPSERRYSGSAFPVSPMRL